MPDHLNEIVMGKNTLIWSILFVLIVEIVNLERDLIVACAVMVV